MNRRSIDRQTFADWHLTPSRYTHSMIPPDLPGADLVQQGIADLEHGHDTTVAALLVLIGSPRLRGLGLQVPETWHESPELRLYERLAGEDSNSAHARYNALIRELVSFERAYSCVA